MQIMHIDCSIRIFQSWSVVYSLCFSLDAHIESITIIIYLIVTIMPCYAQTIAKLNCAVFLLYTMAVYCMGIALQHELLNNSKKPGIFFDMKL